MTETPQYDSLLGGTQELPCSLNLVQFTACRSKEIEAMRHAIGASSSTKLVFQKLPMHMRRRVMSHNAKRLPRRLREIHLNQFKKAGMPPKQKRPSRKYRRRPKNLVEEYARRQHNKVWLETHIWHAKRFHMIEKWGHRLAYSPCDKAFRACYRASTKHCLILDVSYISCIETEGPFDVIISKLKEITQSYTGLSVGAKAFIKGNREGETTIFECGKMKKPIGNVTFIWKPPGDSNTKRTLWIWAHAAFYQDVLKNLEDVFEGTAVKVIERKGDLNRFRLVGPLANALLQKCFKQPPVDNSFEWFQNYLKNDENRQAFSDQFHYWKALQDTNPSIVSPHLILSLIVTDPRYNFPKKRTKAMPENSFMPNELLEIPENLSKTPIWDEHIRSTLKESKISNEEINKLRQQLLVPGTDLEQPGVPIPIMLVQQPGHNNIGGGWDVIIPSGWAQPTWLSLILWGGRAGGLREADSLLFEMGQSELLKPDTKAGTSEEMEMMKKSTETFFKLPPNKRTNYNKYSITSPFTCNWKLLLNEWLRNYVTEFSVMRDKNALNMIQSILTRNTPLGNFNCNAASLIPVRLKIHKGNVRRYSIICLPKSGDYKNLPLEPKREDENEIKRKDMRREHKELLKRLKKRRHRAKENGKVIPIDVKMLNEYKSKMRKLWLPETTTVRKSCSREVIGFVTKGAFSFTSGHSTAVGYIALACLPELTSRQFKNKVLIRNTSSRQYRLATLEIINGSV